MHRLCSTLVRPIKSAQPDLPKCRFLSINWALIWFWYLLLSVVYCNSGATMYCPGHHHRIDQTRQNRLNKWYNDTADSVSSWRLTPPTRDWRSYWRSEGQVSRTRSANSHSPPGADSCEWCCAGYADSNGPECAVWWSKRLKILTTKQVNTLATVSHSSWCTHSTCRIDRFGCRLLCCLFTRLD